MLWTLVLLCLIPPHFVQSKDIYSLKQNGHFTSKTTSFPTAISNRADDLLSAPSDFPSFNQDSSAVKRDSDMPTTSPRAVKALYSPNPFPFTSIIFCTTLPDSEKNQSFILSGTYTLPWITVKHTHTPAPSSSSGACVIHSNLNFLFIISLFVI